MKENEYKTLIKLMSYIIFPLKYLFIFAFLTNSTLGVAINSEQIEEQANASISELYHTLKSKPNLSMTERINWISNQFKGKVYILSSLGEGPNAHFDQFPKYRVDGFDCDTYVTTVVSLALANSLKSFQQCLKFTRYENGIIEYIHRNHFTSLDWNINNQRRGILKDITLNITNPQKSKVALYAEALIDKPSWYAHKTRDTIRLQNNDPALQESRLAELKAQGSRLKITPSKLAYIPLTALFSEKNEPNLHLFSQIPEGAIVEIVRPNWDLQKQIGTALNVSHLGFVFWINKQPYFRQASSQEGKVFDVPLIKYLREAKTSPTIKGINVQIILPSKPISGACRIFKMKQITTYSS
jgi:hypothetical protein